MDKHPGFPPEEFQKIPPMDKPAEGLCRVEKFNETTWHLLVGNRVFEAHSTKWTADERANSWNKAHEFIVKPLREKAEKYGESQAETAALIDFLRTEMDWEYFRAERLYGGKDDQEKETRSRENARQIGNFLKESGHGIAFLKDRDAWKESAEEGSKTIVNLSAKLKAMEADAARRAEALRALKRNCHLHFKGDDSCYCEMIDQNLSPHEKLPGQKKGEVKEPQSLGEYLALSDEEKMMLNEWRRKTTGGQ